MATPHTRQQMHLGMLEQLDPEAHPTEWLADDCSDNEPEMWGDDPLAALERKEERDGQNTFGQPIY